MKGMKWFWAQVKRFKGFIFLSLMSSILFFALFFPTSDLTDLVSSKVSELTKNQVYLQFQDMHLSVFSGLGLKLDTVTLDLPGMPSMNADRIIISPSLFSLFRGKPGGSIEALGFFRGQVKVSLAPPLRSEGTDVQDFDLNVRDLRIQDLKSLIQLPVLLKGQINGQVKSKLDLSFAKQPEGQASINLEKLEFPSQMIQTPMGPLGLPEVATSRIDVRGTLSEGLLRIEEARLGKAGEDLSGLIKGQMKMEMKKVGTKMVPVFGAYSIDIDLTLSPSLRERAVLFLSFIDRFKVVRDQETRYQFRLAAQNTFMPPTMTPIR